AELSTTANFYPWLRIYDPNGVLIADTGINNGATIVEELAFTATNNGTFTVLVSDSSYFNFAGTGAYRLYFAQFPGTFVVPVGDEGGALTNGGNHDGTIQLGDLDQWSFSANAGDRVVLRIGALSTTNTFNPWLRVYGPDGVLIADSILNDGNQTVEELALTATNSGTFRVLVSDSGYFFFGGTGTYRLSSNGLYDGLKLCNPRISGANLVLSAVGGTPSASGVIYSATNVTTPFALWLPVQTNQFDQFGVLTVTTPYSANIPRQFFRLVLP